jgi:hypothetical protein
MNTVLEKLQFVEARMHALEEQLKLTKMEALEQRSRAEVAETWLKIKNRKIEYMEEQEYDEPPPPPSKNTTNWDTVTIPCQVSVERLPSISPKSDRRISLPSPTKSPKSERRTSLPLPDDLPEGRTREVRNRRFCPEAEPRDYKARAGRSPQRTSLTSVRRSLVSPKRSLAKQCWPTVLDADEVKYMSALYAP